MSYYGGTITVKGRNLITSLLAGETLELTRVVVGSGAMPEGVEPIDMEALVNPIAEAVSTVPVVEDGEMFLTVEYRNDLNGGLKEGFWLSEFGIYAKTENSEEVLLYYATLGDSPQPVNAYQDNRIDIRRYPVTIALEVDADVQVTYNPGSFMTADDAQVLIDGMVKKALVGIGPEIIRDITIPVSAWEEVSTESWEEVGEDPSSDDLKDYKYVANVAMEDVLEKYFPVMAYSIISLYAVCDAEVASTIYTLDGYVRFFAKSVPLIDLTGTISVRGETLSTLDMATDEEVQDSIDDIFGQEGTSIIPPGDEIATDEEVQDSIDEIFGQEGTTTIPSGYEIATDEEVEDAIKDIFGD